jgi:hypothetical protein
MIQWGQPVLVLDGCPVARGGGGLPVWFRQLGQWGRPEPRGAWPCCPPPGDLVPCHASCRPVAESVPPGHQRCGVMPGHARVVPPRRAEPVLSSPAGELHRPQQPKPAVRPVCQASQRRGQLNLQPAPCRGASRASHSPTHGQIPARQRPQMPAAHSTGSSRPDTRSRVRTRAHLGSGHERGSDRVQPAHCRQPN